MRFAVQVREKIKHGTRGDITAFTPVVPSIIVFKWVRGRRLSWGSGRWFVCRRHDQSGRSQLWNKDGGGSWRQEEHECQISGHVQVQTTRQNVKVSYLPGAPILKANTYQIVSEWRFLVWQKRLTHRFNARVSSRHKATWTIMISADGHKSAF